MSKIRPLKPPEMIRALEKMDFDIFAKAEVTPFIATLMEGGPP